MSDSPASNSPPGFSPARPTIRKPGHFDPVPVSEAPAIKRTEPWACPSCGRISPAENVFCIACGHDSSKGLAVGTCFACGYDMTGVKSVVCPECGVSNTARNRKRAGARLSSVQVRNEYYYVPAATFLVAAVALWGVAWRIFDFRVAMRLEGQMLGTAFVSAIAYFVLAMLWWGTDMPLHVITLRIFAVASCAA